MISVVCIDNLHIVEVAPDGKIAACPECGCRHFRRNLSTPDVPILGATTGVSVQILEGKHRVGGDTWLTNRGKFVEMLRRDLPGASDAEAKRFTSRWFD